MIKILIRARRKNQMYIPRSINTSSIPPGFSLRRRYKEQKFRKNWSKLKKSYFGTMRIFAELLSYFSKDMQYPACNFFVM